MLESESTRLQDQTSKMEAFQIRIQKLEDTVGLLMDIVRTHNMLPQCPMEPMSPKKVDKVEEAIAPCPNAPIKKSREEAIAEAKRRMLEKKKGADVMNAICAADVKVGVENDIAVPKVERSVSDSSSDSENEDGKKTYKKIPGKICGARTEGEAVEIPGTKSSRSGKPIQAYKPKECGRAAAFVVKTGEDEDDIAYLCAVCHTRHSEDKDTWLGFFDDGVIPAKSHLMGSTWYKGVLAEGMKKLATEPVKADV